MSARGTVRALGAAPIATACVVICGAPTVALALSGAPSQRTARAVMARGATVKRPTRPHSAAPKLVASRFTLQPLAMSVQAGHFVTLQGRLLPAGAGRVVRLTGQTGGRWTMLARARTHRAGRFALRYAVTATGTTALRVSFAGGRGARASAASAGRIVGLEPTVASWYYDAGNTACGFHSHYGVANRTLPCGTQVTFQYGGRSVVATVDDRGPYVYGRSYDLNQNLSARLGMNGVATVLASVQ
jgi:hypothetical protein